jgi:hypothetical protein
MENGIVIVNPDEKDDTEIQLGGWYFDPMTKQTVDVFQMTGRTGQILLSK